MNNKDTCIDFTLKCLEQSSYQQLCNFIQNATDANVERYCLEGVQKFTDSNTEKSLNVIKLLQDLPLERFDKEVIKRVCAVIDDIVDRKPSLRHKVLDVASRIYQSPNNDNASRIKTNSFLYRLVQKYPEIREYVENLTHTQISKLAPRVDKLPDLEYIFMGKEKPSAGKFKTIYNGTLPNKFSGGLWASPKTENGHSAWYNWSERMGETCWTTGAKAYYIQPKKDCRCLVAYSMDDLKPYFYNETYELIKFDVKALKKDYDCIYVSDMNDIKFRYFWMVDSLVVLKADKFDAYTEKEWQKHKQLGKKIKDGKQSDLSLPEKQKTENELTSNIEKMLYNKKDPSYN